MIMCVFLFVLWVLLNGRVTVEICLFGVVIAGAVYAFCVYALGYHPSHEKRLLKRLGGYVVYVAVLIWEIMSLACWHISCAPMISWVSVRAVSFMKHRPGSSIRVRALLNRVHLPDTAGMPCSLASASVRPTTAISGAL